MSNDFKQRTPYQSQRQAPCLSLFNGDTPVCVRSGSPATKYQNSSCVPIGSISAC